MDGSVTMKRIGKRRGRFARSRLLVFAAAVALLATISLMAGTGTTQTITGWYTELTAAGAGPAVAVHGADMVQAMVWKIGSNGAATFTLQGKKYDSPWSNLDSGGSTSISSSTADSSTLVTYTEALMLDSLRIYAYTVASGDSLRAYLATGRSR